VFNWPNDLVSDIARRTCVLYIGAGVSANSSSAKGISPPTWEAFLRSCLTKINKADCAYIEQLLSQKDLLSACEVIIDKIGTAEFNNVAQDAFRRPGFKPASIHETIYNLDARLVITPNVDKIYEQYAQATSCGTIVVKKQTEHDISNFIRSTDRVILKAHGSIDAPNEMIFSKYQYNEARYKYSGFYKLLDSLALTHTYVFIGCGLNDPDIRLTLENYNFGFPGCKPHYFVAADTAMNPDLEQSLLKNCNLKVIKYDNSDGKHEKLLPALNDLVALVEDERNKIAGSQNW
jgi:hypothetical protein